MAHTCAGPAALFVQRASAYHLLGTGRTRVKSEERNGRVKDDGGAATGDAPRQRKRVQGRGLSTLLFAAALALAVLAAFIYLRDNNGASDVRIAPTARPGQNQLADVRRVLSDEGLTVEYGRRNMPAGALSVPGQHLTVDGAPLYAFIYQGAGGAATRERESQNLDPAELLAPGAGGTPGATEPPHIAQKSNVLVALVGGSDDLRDKVDSAIEKLA